MPSTQDPAQAPDLGAEQSIVTIGAELKNTIAMLPDHSAVILFIFTGVLGSVFLASIRTQQQPNIQSRSSPSILVDDNNTIQDYNTAAKDLFPDLSKHTGAPLEAMLKSLPQNSSNGSSPPTISIRNGNSLKEFAITRTSLETKNGEYTAVSFLEITTLTEKIDALETKTDCFDEMASAISHDLRNPLNVAKLNIEQAKREDEDELLEATEAALDRIEEIIDESMTLKKLSEPVEETKPIDLGQITENCWRTIDTADASLAIDKSAVFEGEENRVKRLLENLIRNAIDHSQNDVTITVGSMNEKEGFYLQDTGPGIDSSIEDDIFNQGFSTDSCGTGLGLSIVTAIAEAHGWTIQLDSDYDAGARFEIEF